MFSPSNVLFLIVVSAALIHAQPVPAPWACTNKCDDTGQCGDTCSNLVKKYACSTTYCDSCPYAGWCDKECNTGACAAPGPQPGPSPSPPSPGPVCEHLLLSYVPLHSSPSGPYLLTKNKNSYVCDIATVVAASNDTEKYSFGCSQQYYVRNPS